MRILLAAVAIVAAAPAFADATSGTVTAFDGKSNVLTLSDKTVWYLPAGLFPADTAAGDRVAIDYSTAGEDGIVSIDAIRRY